MANERKDKKNKKDPKKKVSDMWVTRFLIEAQKEAPVTKEELEQWLEYCYRCSIEWRMMTDLDRYFTQGAFFSRCYLTALAILDIHADDKGWEQLFIQTQQTYKNYSVDELMKSLKVRI